MVGRCERGRWRLLREGVLRGCCAGAIWLLRGWRVGGEYEM